MLILMVDCIRVYVVTVERSGSRAARGVRSSCRWRSNDQRGDGEDLGKAAEQTRGAVAPELKEPVVEQAVAKPVPEDLEDEKMEEQEERRAWNELRWTGRVEKREMEIPKDEETVMVKRRLTWKQPPEEASGKHARDQAADDEIGREEFEARVEARGVCYVSRMGPPWFDGRTGEELDLELTRAGMMKAEMESIRKFGVYDEVEEKAIELNAEIIGTRWLLTKKSPTRVKGRVIVQEVNKGGWVDAFSPAPTPIGQRLLLAIAAHEGWAVRLGDVSTAFLHASLDEGEMVFVRPPPGEEKPGMIWQLKKSLYGLRRSPQRFNEHFVVELKKCGWERCAADPQLFYHREERALLSAHVDDLLLAAPSGRLGALQAGIDNAFKVKWAGMIDDKHWESYLGREWRRTSTGFKVRVPKVYYTSLLEPFGLKDARALLTPFPGTHEKRDEEDEEEEQIPKAQAELYHTAVGKLIWLLQERPDLSYAVKELSRHVQAPTGKHWEQ